MSDRIHTVASLFALFGVSLSDLDRRGPREAGKPGEWEREAIATSKREALAAAQAKRERRQAKRRGER